MSITETIIETLKVVIQIKKMTKFEQGLVINSKLMIQFQSRISSKRTMIIQKVCTQISEQHQTVKENRFIIF